MKHHFDIVIAGAGLAGLSLLAGLMPLIQKGKLRVALVDANQLPFQALTSSKSQKSDRTDQSAVKRIQYQSSFDERSTAIGALSQQLFCSFGLWSYISDFAEPIQKIHVSEQGYFGQTHLNAKEHGMTALGYVLPNAVIGKALVARLSELFHSKDVIGFSSYEVIETFFSDQGRQVLLKDRTESSSKSIQLATKLLVIADGGQSPVSCQLAQGYHETDYQQTALVFNVETSRPHDQVAYERFSQYGPLALLPLNQHWMACVWSVHHEKFDQCNFSSDRISKLLQEAIGWRLGKIKGVSQVHRYPLKMRLARQAVGMDWLLLGNAAHQLHPIAGQGFNLIMRDINVLVSLLNQYDSMIDEKLMHTYQSLQTKDQWRTSFFCDQLVKLFAVEHACFGHMRGFGLNALSLNPALKQSFAHQGMGRPVMQLVHKNHKVH